MNKEDFEAEMDMVYSDVSMYGNGYLHVSANGVRRVHPMDLMKEAEGLSKLLLEDSRAN